MKRKRLTWFFFISVILLLLTGLLLVLRAYFGVYLGENRSPDGKFTIRYYDSPNPFRMKWSMPGDSACSPVWVRLYNKDGDKLNEMYTTNCQLGMDPFWSGNQVFLPDDETGWELPGNPGY